MGLGKQAKTLSKGQVEAVLGYLARTRWPTRNRVIFLLSVKAGLRAKEIARLTWRMVIDARGQIVPRLVARPHARGAGCPCRRAHRLQEGGADAAAPARRVDGQ